MLTAGYGTSDYTLKFADVDMDNVTHIFGTKDKNIGRLTTKEVDFLKSKNVTIFETKSDHSDVTYAFIDMLENGAKKF